MIDRIKRFISNQWVVILITSIVSTFGTKLVDCATDAFRSPDPATAVRMEKDRMFIDLAKRLTGQADEATVAQIEEKVVTFLFDEVRKTYLPRNEFETVRESFAQNHSDMDDVKFVMTLASLARSGDRVAYDQLVRFSQNTNALAGLAAANVQEVNVSYEKKRHNILGREILTDGRRTVPVEVAMSAVYLGTNTVGAINSLTASGDLKVVGTLVFAANRAERLDEVFAAVEGVEKLTKVKFPALGVAELNAWWKPNSSDKRYLLPYDRLNQLIARVGRKQGEFSVRSELAWEMMRGMYQILLEERAQGSEAVATGLLNSGLRQGFIDDAKKREELQKMLKLAIERYEASPFRRNDWYVLKTAYLFLYEHEKFSPFVMKAAAEHPSYEQEVKDSHLFNDTLFASPLWPLNKRSGAR